MKTGRPESPEEWQTISKTEIQLRDYLSNVDGQYSKALRAVLHDLDIYAQYHGLDLSELLSEIK